MGYSDGDGSHVTVFTAYYNTVSSFSKMKIEKSKMIVTAMATNSDLNTRIPVLACNHGEPRY